MKSQFVTIDKSHTGILAFYYIFKCRVIVRQKRPAPTPSRREVGHDRNPSPLRDEVGPGWPLQGQIQFYQFRGRFTSKITGGREAGSNCRKAAGGYRNRYPVETRQSKALFALNCAAIVAKFQREALDPFRLVHLRLTTNNP